MATKKDESKPHRSRLTVLAFQLEGSDDTVQEGLRKISQSVENAFRSQRGASIAPRQLADVSAPESNGEVSTESVDEEADTNSPLENEQETTARSRKSKAEKLADVIEFDRSKAKTSFKDYFAEKGQTEKSNQFLVAAGWLKLEAGLAEFTVDHVNTLLREIGVTMPDAPRKMLANMKGRRLLNPGTTKGAFVLNSAGSGTLDRMKSGST